MVFLKIRFTLNYKKWRNLDPEIRKSKIIVGIFKSNVLKFLWTQPNTACYCHNHKGTTLITGVRLGIRHLC